MFFDFEKIPQEGNTAFSIEIHRDEFKDKLKESYKTFVTGKNEDSDSDRDTAWVVLGNYRLDYITVAALMNELSQTFLNRSSAHCPNVKSNENRLRFNTQ